jgi:hypothetical protein
MDQNERGNEMKMERISYRRTLRELRYSRRI